jgi:hypothetical protein
VGSDGTLWAWGDNTSGQLGDGTTVASISPQQIMSGFTAHPTVTSTVPASGAGNVEVDSSITATFSADMDPASITSATFTLNNGVTGAVGYDAATRTATLTPSSDLSHETVYTATISATVRDTGGTTLGADYVFTFTTETGKHHNQCIFISALGSTRDSRLAAMRAFRDRRLASTGTGRAVIRAYKRLSPAAVRLVARRPGLRPLARAVLTPVVFSVMHPVAALAATCCAAGFACIPAARRLRRRARRAGRTARDPVTMSAKVCPSP